MTTSNRVLIERWYVASENSDQTEGRGPMKDTSAWETEQEAYAACIGRGVMGVGNGEVIEVSLLKKTDEPGLEIVRRKVYGYGKDWTGKWSYHWLDQRDAPTEDAEFKEYMRLKEKFGISD